MKRQFAFLLFAVATCFVAIRAGRTRASAALADARPGAAAQFTDDGKLVRPVGYRRWAYVSSGFGMSYNPGAGGNGNPAFTNVFVSPDSYDYFLAHGTWPDKTLFVLEIYGSTSHGSINVKGSYQESLVGLDVEVKDESRFPDKWAYFNFSPTSQHAAAILPSKNDCWNCHDTNAAVEHSFVQFYPELLKVAYARKTIKPSVHLTMGMARLEDLISTQGWERTEPAYEELKKEDPSAEILKEQPKNLLGYRLMNAGKYQDAIGVLQTVVKEFPASPNAYDSLADAYLAAGDKKQATALSEKALDLLATDTSDTPQRRALIEKSARDRLFKLKQAN
ncbi:MAG TPA: cytochrome P460 family protein [Candidatus Acidoferrum sp.]|nr:cytochrome P460 family protein [Candidatus Acidoferrum sp.]